LSSGAPRKISNSILIQLLRICSRLKCGYGEHMIRPAGSIIPHHCGSIPASPLVFVFPCSPLAKWVYGLLRASCPVLKPTDRSWTTIHVCDVALRGLRNLTSISLWASPCMCETLRYKLRKPASHGLRLFSTAVRRLLVVFPMRKAISATGAYCERYTSSPYRTFYLHE
jgi:hypothetical protein